MYARWLYVALLGIALASIEFAASFGSTWQVVLAYGIAAVLGVVVYYQGEARVTPGPIVANVAGAAFLGVAVSLALGTGLFVYFLGTPLDFTLWRIGLILWPTWAGIGVTVLSSFFVTGMVAALS